jgi:DNA-binding GntR family transcriptional regulator
MPEPPVVKSARETAYDYLKASIISGELHPGEIIDDATIADVIGISRTPVREALIQLEKVGLVHAPPRRRPAVAPSNGDDVEQILAPLGALQALAAKLATPLATNADVGLMEDLNRRLMAAAETGDWASAAVADMEFHAVLVHRTNNRFLISEVDNLQTLFNRATRLYMRNRGPDQMSGREHAEIIEAVRNGDPEHAEEATVKNFQRRSTAAETDVVA